MTTPLPHNGSSALIIGGGVIGLSSAIALALRGIAVTLLERGNVGEFAASRRAAGILGAQLELHATAAMQDLCLLSRSHYPAWIETLSTLSGQPIEFSPAGAMRVAFDATDEQRLAADTRRHQSRGLKAEWLSGREARQKEPNLSRRITGAAWFENDGFVDTHGLFRALVSAAHRAGVTFEEKAEVANLIQSRGRIEGVRLANGQERHADAVVLCGGSWSSLVSGCGMPPRLVRPLRGQMLQLKLPAPLQRSVLDGPGAYLCPRQDGRILVGSTVEDVGYVDDVTPEALETLFAAAKRILPGLEPGHIVDRWSGFRASTEDRLPLFHGCGSQGLVIATGHYRNGILLGPISAAIVSSLFFDEPPPVDLSPFRRGRPQRSIADSA